MTGGARVDSRSPPLIRTSELTKVYRRGNVLVEALHKVSLTVQRGEMLAIMGSSGSGKSTLLNLLGCLDRPTSGDYRLEQRGISTLDDNALADVRNTRIGFVFQAFNLLPSATALDNVALPLVYAGVSAPERRARSAAALASLGLADRMHHLPGELSGGQQQRVAIARALVTRPVLILADEPTGAVDSATGREIMTIFQALNQESITVILVTHDETVARVAHRLIELKDGRIVADRALPRSPVSHTADETRIRSVAGGDRCAPAR